MKFDKTLRMRDYTDKEARSAFLHVVFTEPRTERADFLPEKVRERILKSVNSSGKTTRRLASIGRNWLREEIKQALFDIEDYNGLKGFLDDNVDAFFQHVGVLNSPERTWLELKGISPRQKLLFDDITMGYTSSHYKMQSAIARYAQAINLLSPSSSEWIRYQWELANLSEKFFPPFYPIDRFSSPPKKVGLNPINKLLCSEAQRVDAPERHPVLGPNF